MHLVMLSAMAQSKVSLRLLGSGRLGNLERGCTLVV